MRFFSRFYGGSVNYNAGWKRAKKGGFFKFVPSPRKNRFLTQAQISRNFPAMTQGFKSGQGF